MNKALKILLASLFAIFLCVFAFSGYKLFSELHEYKVAENMYNNLSGQYVSSEDKEPAPDATPAPEEEIVEKSPITVDFETMLAQNDDVRGWLYCAETAINYPLAQAEDNDYYLHRFLDGSYNASGTIFLDCTNAGDFSDKNTLLYGHNMNDGSMLACIRKYWEQSYYDAHPIMYLNTPNQNYKVEIFSGYITESISDSYKTHFDDDQFPAWIDKIRSQSDFTSEVSVGAEDNIITLSTCTYEYHEARYVLHGKLVPIA